MEQEKSANVPRKESSSEDGFWTEGEKDLSWGSRADNKTLGDCLSQHVKQIVRLKEEVRILKDRNSQQLKDQDKQFRERIAEQENKVAELIKKITIARLSDGFSKKVTETKKERVIFLISFYVMLVVAFGLSATIVFWKMPDIPNNPELVEWFKVIVLRFVCWLPIYLPVIWAIIHFNRWAAQKNRLTEEYDHKKVVVETYVGLADQIDELRRKGVHSVPELLANLQKEVVNVICFDASSVIDKARIMTPIGEGAKLIESLGKTSAEIVNAKAS